MNLASQEAELIGSWRLEGKHVVADATCRRIEQLIKDRLRKLAAIQSYGQERAAQVLLQSPESGDSWSAFGL